MKYWKNLQGGVVRATATKPTDFGWWVETTEREYNAYRARIARAVANLERAVAYKKRVLRADE